jgi:hypothetical protein
MWTIDIFGSCGGGYPKNSRKRTEFETNSRKCLGKERYSRKYIEDPKIHSKNSNAASTPIKMFDKTSNLQKSGKKYITTGHALL